MVVTKLEDYLKDRVKVYIDYEFAFVLYSKELRIYGIAQDKIIEKKQYDTLMGEVLPKRAKLRAMNLLKSRDYTTQQMRDKLKQGFYPDEIIEEAIAYVASFHYIDDLRYAVSYITCYENQKSKKRIEQDLQSKGISKGLLDQAFMDWEELGGKSNEEEMIKKLLKKRNYNPATADIKEKQRNYGFLLRKGFSYELVNRALNSENSDSYT